MPTPQEHRAAQRRLAREIKTGTYKPSAIGRKAREVAGNQKIIDDIQALKQQLFGNSPNWRVTSSRRHIAVNATTGKIRQRDELLDIRDRMQNAIANLTPFMNRKDTWHEIFDDMEPDYPTIGFYKLWDVQKIVARHRS